MNFRIVRKCSKLEHLFFRNRKSCYCPFHCNYLLIRYNLAVFILSTNILNDYVYNNYTLDIQWKSVLVHTEEEYANEMSEFYGRNGGK